MIKSSSDNTSPRWKRSAVKGTLIGVRLQPSQLKALDAWIDKQDASLTRPEAIRAMMETILHILSKDRGEKPPRRRRPDERNHASENHRIRCDCKSNGTKGPCSKSKPAMD